MAVEGPRLQPGGIGLRLGLRVALDAGAAHGNGSDDKMPSILRKMGNAVHRRIGAARPWRDGYNMGGIDIYTASGQSLIHGLL